MLAMAEQLIPARRSLNFMLQSEAGSDDHIGQRVVRNL